MTGGKAGQGKGGRGMVTAGDQSAALGFLTAEAARAGRAERHDTHISAIFLGGDLAWKLKRAVRLPYADFSTEPLRRAACARELALNRPHAPGIYRRVRAITRTADGGLEWDGPGEAVDHVVEMARFDQDDLLSARAAQGRLTLDEIETLAGVIAAHHAAAPPTGDPAGADRMGAMLSVNEAGFATSRVLPGTEVARLNRAFRDRLAALRPALDARARAGHVRRCHGDLHLRNICLWQGQPCLFDGLEFNEALATTDTLYDLAFLLMDLWDNGLDRHANLLANRYMDLTGDQAGWPLLPFLMAIRAAVRAHVTATQAETARGGPGFAVLAGRAARYFALADRLLASPAGRVIAIGGLSGSGKTTLAEALAPGLPPAPGARVMETDRIRKALFGVAPTTRLPPEAYAPEVSARVYARLFEGAAALAAGGASVILSAVLDRPADRAAAARAAGAARFDGLWLTAPPDILRARIAARASGVSDAGVAVLDLQLAGHDPAAIDWSRIDVSGSLADSVAAARRALAHGTAEGAPQTAAPAPPDR